ncbi:MAG: endonuclease/exonuclease/phosphatase family protein [Segetibacter sp.]|jgi:endonuclease/exonuclease/phosphatase (EEP) superfamily protein YafD|nr:endonuclease/exonuclease/phosphatase family protein [Segetibacter sp.]
MRYFTWIISIFSIIVTALPFIQSPVWWIRIFDFPRLQIAIVCLISIILCLIYVKEKKVYQVLLSSLLVIAFGYQSSQIIVYTPLYPLQAKHSNYEKASDSFSLMIANILMTNQETEAFKKQVYKYNPDILVITEPNAAWELKLRELDNSYPYSIKYPLENTYGMLLYSKLPLKNKKVNFFVNSEVPSFYASVNLPSGNSFDLYSLHPKPPRPGTNSYEWDTEVLIAGRKIREHNRPALVAGDLNDVAWSRTTKRFRQYSQLGDPRQGRGLFNTYNAQIPLLRYPLDHVFYSENFGLIKMKKLNNGGSDHFPIYIQLSFEPSADKIKNLPEVDTEDKKIIKEKIQKQTGK